jgi:N6-L-threonylcarbamoyladenine synthase
MIILGIESTAHTFGVGIITEKGDVLANAIDSYTSKDIGMIPHEIAEHHNKVAEKVLKQAMEEANVSWKEIEFIAYSAGPGLDPALWAGYHIAKKWAENNHKELVGINHCCAHLSIGKVYNKLKDPCYVYVSGVNTQIIVEEGGKYRVMGETLDIGLGNMLDKFGRVLGLGFPAGPKIEELAKSGKFVELPYVVKGMDVSFSGILTKVEQLLKRNITHKELLKKQGKSVEMPFTSSKEDKKILEKFQNSLNKTISKEDLCFSMQETCFAMVAEVTERAMAHNDKKELLLVGGVGANKRFCKMLEIMCEERGAKFYKVPMDLAGDQGAMIAWEGYLRRKEFGDIEVNPHWRTDEV